MKNVVEFLLVCVIWAVCLDVGAAGQSRTPNIRLVPGATPWGFKEEPLPPKPAPKHEACEKGFYTGPRAERVHHTKDEYVWAVTPEFARNYCMPDEFVYPDLQGAEAVAIRLIENPYKTSCSVKYQQEECLRYFKFGVELFVRSDAHLPKQNAATYFNGLEMPSSWLIDPRLSEIKNREDFEKSFKRPGFEPIFKYSQVLAFGATHEKAEWLLFLFKNNLYIQNYFSGLDYISFIDDLSSYEKNRAEKMDEYDFYIAFAKNEDASWYKRPIAEYQHLVHLPKNFMKKLKVHFHRYEAR